MNEEIARLEGQIQALTERISELEIAVFLGDEEFEEAVDPLEEAHQRFAEGIRSQREGNA